MATQKVEVKSELVSVDLVVWQKYKWPMPGVFEQTLDQNYGLAAKGVILPLGTTFDLPLLNPTDVVPTTKVVKLW